MSALPEPQRFEAMPRSHEWGFCLPELLLLVQLDPINGFDTTINQLSAQLPCRMADWCMEFEELADMKIRPGAPEGDDWVKWCTPIHAAPH